MQRLNLCFLEACQLFVGEDGDEDGLLSKLVMHRRGEGVCVFGAVEQAVSQDIEMPWAEELQQSNQRGNSLGGREDGPHALRDLLLIAT